MKVNKKDILNMAKNLNAEDLTNASIEYINQTKEKEQYFEDVAHSLGVYGCNACIVKGHKTSKFYFVRARNRNLWYLM